MYGDLLRITMFAMSVVLVIVLKSRPALTTCINIGFEMHGNMSLQQSLFREKFVTEITLKLSIEMLRDMSGQVLWVFILLNARPMKALIEFLCTVFSAVLFHLALVNKVFTTSWTCEFFLLVTIEMKAKRVGSWNNFVAFWTFVCDFSVV